MAVAGYTQYPVHACISVLYYYRLCWREGVDAVDEERRTPLIHAVHGSHYDCVLMLIEAGANLNAIAAGIYEQLSVRCVCAILL